MNKLTCLLVLGFTALASAANGQIAQQPSVKMLAPDLTFGKIHRQNTRMVEIVVMNQGKVKSAATDGVFNCLPVLKPGEVGIGFGSLLAIKALSPGETFKVKMDCGAGKKITGAGLDGYNKVHESNEKNNGIAF